MNLLDAIRGLIRRWYVSLPGLIIAIAVAVGVWAATPPDYQRTASQLLLPGENLLPEGATNQFLYIGGLSPVADVLTRAVGSSESVQQFQEEGAVVGISRDASAQGPVLLITVTAKSDSAAAAIVEKMLTLSGTTLKDLQAEQGIAVKDRVTVTTIAVDRTSEKIQRSRIVLTAAVGLGVAFLALVLASTIDGLFGRRKRRIKKSGREDSIATEDNADETALHEGESLDEHEDDRSGEADDTVAAGRPARVEASAPESLELDEMLNEPASRPETLDDEPMHARDAVDESDAVGEGAYLARPHR